MVIFSQGIYQLFYTEESSSEKGTLYHLRNFVNRRNVTGPEDVTSNFRSHQQFVDDVTDAYIVGTFLDNMEMETLSSAPKSPPLFTLLNDGQIKSWIMQEAGKIMDCLNLNNFANFNFLHEEISKLDADETVLNSMLSDAGYACAVCGKAYSKAAWFKKHLQKKHGFVFSDSSSFEMKINPVHCFLQMSLILRDTIDSYKMGDGDRIARNAYFEWLFASSLHHTKYAIWLWRMIAYIDAVLTPAESVEYKWNMTVNLKGGPQNNIPNDNCVELQIGNIKRQLNTQGSNKSFQSAQNICMTTQVVEAIMENVQRTVQGLNLTQIFTSNVGP
ncbi:uncharacterized protein LOC134261026 [Saccostrea cucullata]|uniref:uncharacterized protein LOC134261026 n=1 Tax=Saccostrea cuccullata TaxID=36930 RepID=UPI002ED11D70